MCGYLMAGRASADSTDRLITKIFHLPNAKWGYLNLNDLAAKEFSGVTPNPLNDPQKCSDWIRKLHQTTGIDYSYGGYLEDRKDLWRAHYHPPGHTTHLGVDYNVPENTEVFAPTRARLIQTWIDKDPNGGWGGRIILQNDRGLYLVVAHLDPSSLPNGDKIFNEGDPIGRVGNSQVNGGWFPHLHLQAMRQMSEAFDGYGTSSAEETTKFPHPINFLD